MDKKPYCLRSAVAQNKENKLSENKFRTEIVFLKPQKVRLSPAFKRCSEKDTSAKFKAELFESEQNKKTSLVSQQTDFMIPQATLVLSPMLKKCKKIFFFCQFRPLEQLKPCIHESAH